jgi:hypothetical protein
VPKAAVGNCSKQRDYSIGSAAAMSIATIRADTEQIASRDQRTRVCMQREGVGKRLAFRSAVLISTLRLPQESRMHWKKRQKQIQKLQAKHGNDRSLAREFPDLKVEQRTAPCSNGMRGAAARRVLPLGMKQFPVGHCHKQGYELIIPGTDLQWMAGKKP